MLNINAFGKKFDCGCENRKDIFMSGEWKTDLAILVVLALSIAAIYVGLKTGKVIDGQ